MKKLLIIEADTNDADYVHSLNYLNDKEIKFIRSIVSRLKKSTYGGFLWENGECGNPFEEYEGILTVDEVDVFQDYVPYGEFGIHTIENIRILDVANEEYL